MPLPQYSVDEFVTLLKRTNIPTVLVEGMEKRHCLTYIRGKTNFL